MDMILSWRSNDHVVLNDKLQTLIEKMDHLESKANDIECEVRNEEFQSRKRRKSEVKLWLERVSECKEDIQSISREVENIGSGNCKRLLNEIKGTVQHLDELLKQAGLFKGLVLDDLKPEGIKLLGTEKLEGSTPLEVQNKVWSALSRGESRIGIYGMGGVGKTCMAMHINDGILDGREDFKHVYYVTVSRGSSVYKLQGDIARALQLNLRNEDHETRRTAELRMLLKKRDKSLLILDDVWEDIRLEEVGVAVEGDGCKLLITTRKRDVCRKMNCTSIVEMRPLLENEAWDLFVSRLGNYEQLSDEAKGVARSICEECSGLPLAIITMAICMRGEFDEPTWRVMLRQLQNPSSNQNDMEVKVFNILKHSYERLNNDNLRECLLYCALYPEDDEIPRDKLINRFIAVGLSDGSTRKENTDMGHFNLNALESASLLESVTDYKGKRFVKMHDLIRDMALKIIGWKGIVKPRKSLKEIPGKDEWTKDLVRVSLMNNYIKDIGVEICPECPNLSVLILRCNPLQNISHSFFVHMAGLRCLDLSKTRIDKLPNSIANLRNLGALLLNGCYRLKFISSLAGLIKLRDLNLSGTGMEELPEGVVELINLEYLDISRTGIEKLPDGVEKLINLEYLNVSETRIQNIPAGLLGKLCKLESLLSNFQINISPKNLTSLRQLSSFAGWIADFDASEQFVGSDSFNRLERYSICIGDPINVYSSSFGSCESRRIIIHGRQLGVGGEVCFKVPQNAQILQLESCSFGGECLLEALPSLRDVTEVELCRLASCQGIKYIISDAWFEQGRNQVTTPLKGVRGLDLFYLDDFVGLYEGRPVHPRILFGGLKDLRIEGCTSVNKIWLQNDDVLPNLESIQVVDCNNMEEVFAAAEGASIKLPKLEKVDVRWCPKLEKLWSVKDEIPSLQSVYVESCDQMKEIFATTIEWPKLHSLTLQRLPELKSICRNVVFFPGLERLQIWECPKLKKLRLLNHSMPSLWEMSIIGCRGMEEIFERADEAGGDAIELPDLEIIDLSDSPELTSICRKAIVCNSLKRVKVSGDDKLENFPISVPRLLTSVNPPFPILVATGKRNGWWNSLYWNDPATKLAFHQLGCFQMY